MENNTDHIEMEDELFVQLFSEVNTHLAARLLSRLEKKEIEFRLSLLPELI